MDSIYKNKKWRVGIFFFISVFFILGLITTKAQEIPPITNNQVRLQDPELDLLYQLSVHVVRLGEAIKVYENEMQNIIQPLGHAEDRFNQLLLSLDARNLNEAQREAESLSADIKRYLTPMLKSEKALDPANGDALRTNTIKQETVAMMKLLEEFEPKISTFQSRVLVEDKRKLFNILIKKLRAQEITDDIFLLEQQYSLHEELASISNDFSYYKTQMFNILTKKNIGVKDGQAFFSVKQLNDEDLSVLATQPEIATIAYTLHTIVQKLDAVPEQQVTSGLEGDMNGDNKVDIFDLVIVAKNFGKKI